MDQDEKQVGSVVKVKDEPSATKNKKTFEEVLQDCGGFGKFQFLILVTLLLPEIPAAFVTFAPVFVGSLSSSNWTCVLGLDTAQGHNATGSGIVTIGSGGEDMCDCPGTLQFYGDSSIVSEWGLVCRNAWVSDFITSVQMLGMLFGSLFASQISDWYGRKWVYYWVCILMALGQCLSAIATNPVIYAGARFIAGAGISGFMGQSTVYPLEFMTPNWRGLTSSVGPWGEGIMLFAVLAYLVHPWRQLLLYSAAPFSIVFAIVPFIPESPRWLLRQGRVAEALKIVRKIQQVNGTGGHVHISYEMLEEIAQRMDVAGGGGGGGDNSKGRSSYLHFFREKGLRKKTLLLMCIWFAYSIVYYGITFNVKSLKGNVFLNVGLLGLSDALGYPAALLINDKLGRRKSLVLFMSIAALFLVLLATLDIIYGPLASATVLAILCVSGKIGVSGARSAARMLTSESFPTSIRTMGYGITGVVAGLGGILAPQIVYFGSLWWSPLPFVAFAVISILGSVFSLLLEETAGQVLTDDEEHKPKK